MLVKHLKIITDSIKRHKELIAVYLFEECFCDAFLSVNLVSQHGNGTLASLTSLVPILLLLIVGLGMSHLSGVKAKPQSFSKTNTLNKFVHLLNVLQKRFPIVTTLSSILLVVTGEIIEQELLQWCVQLMISTPAPLFFLLLSGTLIFLSMGIKILLALPFVLVVHSFLRKIQNFNNSTTQNLVNESQSNNGTFFRFRKIHSILPTIGIKANRQSYTALCTL